MIDLKQDQSIVLDSQKAQAFRELNQLEHLNVFRAGSSYNSTLLHNNGVRLSPNEWLILDKKKGRGGFGTVYQCRRKVVVEEYQVRVYPVNLVVKEQVLSSYPKQKAKKLEAIKEEIKYQAKHRVLVKECIVDKNTAFIVMEDCGLSLDKVLPHRDFSFNQRVAIAQSIANEMLLLKQSHTVHRDLKLENICLMEEEGAFRVRFIDFGISVHNDQINLYKNTAGTLLYMAPDKNPSYSSDIYALSAILGQLFGCSKGSLFKLKAANPQKYYQYHPYDFSELFLGIKLPEDVDECLLLSFKSLLNTMQSSDPKIRPDIEVVLKFLTSIPYRQAKTRAVLEQLPLVSKILSQLDKTSTSLFKEIKKTLDTLRNPISHFIESERIVKENRLNSEYSDPYLLAQFEEFYEEIKLLDNKVNTLSQKETDFIGTNSSGATELFTILKSKTLSTIEKLDQLKRLGESKTENSLSNWYSRSHFFAKGRHKNMELLYKKCADLSLTDETNSIESLITWEETIRNQEGFRHLF